MSWRFRTHIASDTRLSIMDDVDSLVEHMQGHDEPTIFNHLTRVFAYIAEHGYQRVPIAEAYLRYIRGHLPQPWETSYYLRP